MTPSIPLPRNFFTRDPVIVARELIGKELMVDGVGGVITETEAYDGANDPAAHTFKGLSKRNKSMFDLGGTLYVYRIHRSFCMNAVARETGEGAAVLIRAIYPTKGFALIAERRSGQKKAHWCNGPGKVTQSLNIGLEDDGIDLLDSESRVTLSDWGFEFPSSGIDITPRIGISKAKEFMWRFWVPKPLID
jgi:DNA-3-methyladenine glycosylase